VTIQSVDRALQILLLFSHHRPQMGVAQISRNLSLSKGTVHGLVRTLVQHGFLTQDPATRKYRLGLRIHELGMVLAGTLELNLKAARPCQQLAKRSQLLTRVAIWDGDAVVITLNTYPAARPVLPHQIGPRVHAYCSATGKAVLAFLDEASLKAYLDRTKLVPFTPATITAKKRLIEDLQGVRERGYSIDREEAVEDLACIGAPLFERDGIVAGSLSLSGPPSRVLGRRMETLAGALVSAAAEISRNMGYDPASGTAAIHAPKEPTPHLGPDQ
jgi:DNA-binding IclR family transcriptional regulator